MSKTPHLVLGTAQLGLVYGVVNGAGMPGQVDAIAMLRAAAAAGIRVIDTARAYGEAERRIGLALASSDVTVITKLDPLAQIAPADPHGAAAAAAASLAASRATLQRQHLDVVLLHRAVHRTAWDGAVWRVLCAERTAGRIGGLGVSAQAPREALEALADPEVVHIQLPFNLLDHRWEEVIDALREKPQVTVHIRSVLLQGLLAGAADARWPAIAGVEPCRLLGRLRELARQFGRSGLVDLCFAYAGAQDWIDGIVVGMETRNQLTANLELFARPPLTNEETDALALPRVPDALLDPAQWPRA